MTEPSLQSNSELRELLERFEANLESPAVPGEMEQWVQAVHRSFEDLEERAKRRIREDHRAEFDEIVDQDPGLSQRVEDMQRDDRDCLERLQDFHERISRLAGKISEIEPDEKLARKEFQEIVDRGLALVIQIRKQEKAVSTWLSEALSRDGGTVD